MDSERHDKSDAYSLGRAAVEHLSESAGGTGLTAAAAAIQALRDAGIRTVFGIPGVHNQALYDALVETPEIESVVTRHEQGAAFMADGYARASGRPGVCLLITGPGLTNAATAIAEAFSDSVPIVCIVTGYLDHPSPRGRRLHELKNQARVIEGLFKLHFRVEGSQDVAKVIATALSAACEGRPGPVAVEVPIEVLADLNRASAEPPLITVPEDVPELVDLRGPRPVVVVGGGCVDAAEEVVKLIEHLGAVTLCTAAGKGVVRSDNPLNLGARLRSETAREVVASANPLVLLGTEWSTTDLGEKTCPLPKKVVRINKEENVYPWVGAQVTSSVKEYLDYWLAGALNEGDGVAPCPWSVPDLLRAAKSETSRWSTFSVECIEILNKVLREDAIVVNDMNTLSYAAVDNLNSFVPRSFLFPRGYGTLGYAVPAAVGARMAQPGRQVVALCGDGGFLFTSEELATAPPSDRTLTEILADTLTVNIHSRLEYALDFHCHVAGAALNEVILGDNYVSSQAENTSREMALAFQSGLIHVHDLKEVTGSGQIAKRGGAVCVPEIGGGGLSTAVEQRVVDQVVDGILDSLRIVGMLPGKRRPFKRHVMYEHVQHVRPTTAGYLVSHFGPDALFTGEEQGVRVKEGQPLGYVFDPYTLKEKETIAAPVDGILYFTHGSKVVEAGAHAFSVAVTDGATVVEAE